MFYLCVQGFLHVLAKLALERGALLSVSNQARVTRYERYALAVLAFSWLTIHVAIVVGVRRFANLQRRHDFEVRTFLEKRNARYRQYESDRGYSSMPTAPSPRPSLSLRSKVGRTRQETMKHVGLDQLFGGDDDDDDDAPPPPMEITKSSRSAPAEPTRSGAA